MPLQCGHRSQPAGLREFAPALDADDAFVGGMQAPFAELRPLAGGKGGESKSRLIPVVACDPGCGEQAIRLLSAEGLATNFPRAEGFRRGGRHGYGDADEADEKGQ
jgi:hypothetical protein